ncbi:MAG: hypothetical protein ONB33_00010 [candidate division KSB1 bacterium]|nr:hypothetical protein [candidate division KSB1 bacterium]
MVLGAWRSGVRHSLLASGVSLVAFQALYPARITNPLFEKKRVRLISVPFMSI